MAEQSVEEPRGHQSWCPFDGRVQDPDHVCWKPAAATTSGGNPMTPAATITSLIAEDHFTQAMDVHEQHLKASAQTGNLTAALDLLVVRNQRERLGDEAAALDVLAALSADVPT